MIWNSGMNNKAKQVYNSSNHQRLKKEESACFCGPCGRSWVKPKPCCWLLAYQANETVSKKKANETEQTQIDEIFIFYIIFFNFSKIYYWSQIWQNYTTTVVAHGGRDQLRYRDNISFLKPQDDFKCKKFELKSKVIDLVESYKFNINLATSFI
jgi:hypothetical protein